MPPEAEPSLDRPLAGRRLAILALADLGRSPRMVLHAVTAAALGADVDLVGLEGVSTPPELGAVGVRVHRVDSAGLGLPPGGGGLTALWRSGIRMRRLGEESAAVLRRLARPNAVLCATPPALPAISVAWRAARCHGAPLVIDWHNFAASLLALKLGARHPLVFALDRRERRLGRLADGHLCVSQAMARELCRRLGPIEPVVVYDRAADRFGAAAAGVQRDPPEEGDRAMRLVVPTGWTLDEEPTPLLEALERYDRAARDDTELPPLCVTITGEGPLRNACEQRVRVLELQRVEVRTAWLPPDAYADLLARADLGISLHRSSSGLDLAMKVADMLGAGLPVCAFDYGSCLREQVRPGEDAVLFRDGAGLATILRGLLAGHPHPSSGLARLRARAAGFRRPSWRQEWYPRAAVVLGLAPQRPGQ